MTIERGFKQLKKAGGQFLFEFFLETYHDEIINGLRDYLSQFTSEDIPDMVKETRFPETDSIAFDKVEGYEDYLEKITPIRLLEAIAEARPDLAKAIQDQGMDGAEYMVKLRNHFLNLIKNPGKAVVSPPKKKGKMLQAHCDNCGADWPVPADQVDSIKECPFCHTPKDESAASSPGDEEPESS